MLIWQNKQFGIRPFRSGDKADLAKNLNNFEITKFLSRVPFPYTKKDAQNWIEESQKQYRKCKPDSLSFAITIKDKVVGGIGFNEIEDFKADIGYWLGEKHWVNGIMTEAVKKLIQYGFNQLNLVRISAITLIDNTPSQKVLLKCGFIKEGELHKYLKKDDKIEDVFLFAITK